MGRLGYECERLDGLHLNVDLCAVRIVGEDGRDVPPGEQGELVVSSLRNRAMVLINYRLGDVGTLDTEPCSCGRKLPVLRELQGRRTSTMVLADGRQVSSLDLEWAFRTELRPTIRAQLVQRGPGRLHWRLVPFGAADPAELERSLVARAHQLFGDSTVLTVECVDRLASNERGKFERTVLDPAPGPVSAR
jgi:phenylacetate-CoA ligase